MNETIRKERRKFDETFKREALNHWLSSGKSAAQVAAELGIFSNLLFSWRRRQEEQDDGRAAANAPPPLTLQEAHAQLAAARRENARLREQRDILKKTLGIFSELPPSSTNGSIK